jgi:hypothetical protein
MQIQTARPDRYAETDALVNQLRAAVERAVNAATTPEERERLRQAGAGALRTAQQAYAFADVAQAQGALTSFRNDAAALAGQRPSFETREAARLAELEAGWCARRAHELFEQLIDAGASFRLERSGAIRVIGQAAGDLTDAELADARRCAAQLRNLITERLARERCERILLPPESESDGDTN